MFATHGLHFSQTRLLPDRYYLCRHASRRTFRTTILIFPAKNCCPPPPVSSSTISPLLVLPWRPAPHETRIAVAKI